MTGGPIRVLEFESVEAMRAHYKALRARTTRVRRNKALAIVGERAAPPVPEARPHEYVPPQPEGPTWADLRAEADALVRAGAQRARALALEEREADEQARGYEPIRDVIARHAVANGVSVADVLSPARTADVVRARQVAMVELWDGGRRMSALQVGRIFGRNHTTVLHAIRKLAARRLQGGEG